MSRNKYKYKYNYIYLIYDIKYDKFYIGKKSSNENIKDNVYADGYFGSGKIIQRIVNKYRDIEYLKYRFKKCILEFSSSYDENIENEKKWIWFFDSQKSEDFYNISSGGEWGDITRGMNNEEYNAWRKKKSSSLKRKIVIIYKNNRFDFNSQREAVIYFDKLGFNIYGWFRSDRGIPKSKQQDFKFVGYLKDYEKVA